MGVAHEQADAVAAMADADYLALLQQRFGSRAGRFTRVGKRVAYPIRRLLATQLVAPRAVMIGNDAQNINPIGAQGFNLGLRDSIFLAELLAAGGDPGQPERRERRGVGKEWRVQVWMR